MQIASVPTTSLHRAPLTSRASISSANVTPQMDLQREAAPQGGGRRRFHAQQTGHAMHAGTHIPPGCAATAAMRIEGNPSATLSTVALSLSG